MQEFLETLRIQRWDDHRYYHHSRINQSLHLVSALNFLFAYWLIMRGALAEAGLLAWLVSMTTRQAGHFFFEPKGYDYINHATHGHKEEIKVGYNLRRKVVLMSLWALSPLVVLTDPTLHGLLPPAPDTTAFLDNLGVLWALLGIAGLLFRTLHLFYLQDVQTGLAWAAKIVTDPFNDVKLYWRAPFHLLRGELIDPNHARQHS